MKSNINMKINNKNYFSNKKYHKILKHIYKIINNYPYSHHINTMKKINPNPNKIII